MGLGKHNLTLKITLFHCAPNTFYELYSILYKAIQSNPNVPYMFSAVLAKKLVVSRHLNEYVKTIFLLDWKNEI